MFLTKVIVTILNIGIMIIITPFLLLFIIPLALYRLLIKFSAKLLRPDLTCMISPRDSIFANDEATKTPSSSIITSLVLNGDPDIEEIRRIITDTLYGGNTTVDNQKYPRFVHYFQKWCGFVFLKKQEKFDISTNIREWKKPAAEIDPLGDSPVTTDDLYNLRRKLLKEPYTPRICPCEFILVRNFEEDKEKPRGTILISKVHHGLVDGYSILKVLLTVYSNVSNMTSAIPQTSAIEKPLTLLQNLIIFSTTFLSAPSNAVSQTPKIYRENIFHPSNTKLKGLRHPVNAKVPISTIKMIAKQTHTSFTAVQMEALTGGIRNYLISKKKEVPRSIDVSIPLPWPGHGDKMRNHFTFAVLEIPTGIQESSERLKYLHGEFCNLKKSTVPAFNFVMAYLAGMLPNPLMSAVLKGTPSSILLSSLPGPQREIQILGYDLKQTFFEGGYGQGDLGMGVTMMSYNGNVGITINPDEGIIPTKSDAEYLLQCIMNQFQFLSDTYML